MDGQTGAAGRTAEQLLMVCVNALNIAMVSWLSFDHLTSAMLSRVDQWV
jgi:hypothetical protein